MGDRNNRAERDEVSARCRGRERPLSGSTRWPGCAAADGTAAWSFAVRDTAESAVTTHRAMK